MEQPTKTIETSLTSPEDRDPKRTYKPNKDDRVLSEEEVVNAVKENDDNSFVKKFLKIERRYADPVDPFQKIGLISFVPAKGATPNKNGIYGFAKLRGNYPTDVEASQKAEQLIRNTDSHHKIYHAYVGRPFPLTSDKVRVSADVNEVDVRTDISKSVSASIKQKKNEEIQKVKEIEERERLLKEDTGKDIDEQDPEEVYTTLRVKKAQSVWAYLDAQKKIEELKQIIIKTRAQIVEMDNESSEYKEKYFQKYLDARKESGLDLSTNNDTFMKFMVEDVELGF